MMKWFRRPDRYALILILFSTLLWLPAKLTFAIQFLSLSAIHSYFLVIFHLQSFEVGWNLKLNYELKQSLLLTENLIDVTLCQKSSHDELHALYISQ